MTIIESLRLPLCVYYGDYSVLGLLHSKQDILGSLRRTSKSPSIVAEQTPSLPFAARSPAQPTAQLAPLCKKRLAKGSE